MIRRTTRIALELVAGVLALAAVVLGVGVWRVAQGPVALDFLTPRLEAALSGGAGNFEVRLGSTVLAWEGWPETFALRVRDVQVRSRARTVARIPEVDLRLSLPALASGTVAPTLVAGRGARLTVVRDADGLRFAGAAAAPTASGDTPADGRQDISRLAPALLDDLMAAPAPERPLSYLRRLSVRDTRLVVRDKLLGMDWVAPNATIDLSRTPDGVSGQADLALDLDGQRVSARAELAYTRGSGRIDLAARFDDLRADALAAALPQLHSAHRITVPLSAQVTATVALSGEVLGAEVSVDGGRGQIAWPDRLPDPRPVRGLALAARYDPARQQVTLDRLNVDFGTDAAEGPTLTASGRLRRDPDGPVEAQLTVGLRRLDLDQLGAYWPVGVAVNARDWVVPNIRTGTARQARATARLRLPAGAPPEAVELVSLDGSIDFSGLDVHYLRPLPPVTGVDGRASFTESDFDIAVSSGRLDTLAVPGGDIRITGLDESDQFIDIDFDLTGPLQRALGLLDHPRLDLMAPLGLDPEKVSGRIAQAGVQFDFPLIDDLTFEETNVRAEAALEDVRLRDFALGQDATNGRFDLRVDKAGMTVEGPLRLGGVEVSRMVWREHFTEDAEVVSRIDARVPALDSAARARLGLEARPYLDGPVGLSVDLRSFADGATTAELEADLGAARLAVPEVDWAKPPGNAGRWSARLRLEGDTPTALEQLALSARGADGRQLMAEGGVRFAEAQGRLERVALDRLALGRTDLRGVRVTRRGDNGWSLRLSGGTLVLTPFLEAPVLKAERSEHGDPPPLELRRSTLDRVYVAPDRYVEDVALSARRGPDGWWQRVRVEGTAPPQFVRRDGGAAAGTSRFELDYGPSGGGRHGLVVDTDDSGAVLRALDIYDGIVGGALRITGRTREPAPGSPLVADVRISDFTLVRAPTMARILTLASFTGIRNLLEGAGVGFQSLTGEVVYDRGTLSTELLHAYGPALGVTAKGTVDLDARDLDMNGVVVPAASTNRALNTIPVLGKLLTGGEGEGVFAVTYTVTGSFDSPEVSVNPLSALAPGFLRGLFGRLGELEGRPPPEDWPRAQPRR